MRQIVVALMVLIGLFAVTPPAMAESPTIEQMLADKVLGNPNAPITILDYASLTCPHCADFHKKTLPELKAKWIDTGKVKFIFRDFPLDAAGLLGAKLARCAGDERYFGMLDMLFRSQATWSLADDPQEALSKIGRMARMSKEDMNACFANSKLADGIVAERLEGSNAHKVDSTPTFIINGKKHAGFMTFDELDRILKEQAP